MSSVKRAGRLRIQKWVGWLLFLPFCGPLILILKWIFRYRIQNLAETRKFYRELTDDRTPLLICSNHATYVDPVLLIYAFGRHDWYWRNFRRLTWNLPAMEYSQVFFFRLVGALGKCIFIDRGGERKHHQEILDIARGLLEKGEPVMIFPEGRRSRTGRFDSTKLAYGIGKVIAPMRACRVLCVYIQSLDGGGFAKFPKSGTMFALKCEVIHFEGTPGKSDPLDVARITETIAWTIQDMEPTPEPMRELEPALIST